MKFLIVDDSRAMQVIIKRGLENLGYKDNEFKMASNGKDALNIIRDWNPDLVLSDWHMPEITGIELLQLVRRLNLSTKIGFVTSERSESRLESAKEAGALFIVSKPFEDKTLHEAILPILQGSIEGEHALGSDLVEQASGMKNILLPECSAFTKAFNALSDARVTLKPVEIEPFDYSRLPFVIGLYSVSGTKSIRSICVLDLAASCYLGAAIGNLSKEEADEAITQKAIPKALLDYCNKIMKVISVLFFDPKSDQDLILAGVHLVPKPFAKLDSLSEKQGAQRMDVLVDVEGFGQGRLSVLAVNQ